MRLQKVVRTVPARLARREASPEHLARRDSAGLKAALKIAGAWQLSNPETARLLGVPERTLYRWKQQLANKELVGPLPRDTMERISYLLGIWKDLAILFPAEASRLHWLRADNRSPAFGGRPPRERLLRGNVGDLYAVRQYLDGWRG